MIAGAYVTRASSTKRSVAPELSARATSAPRPWSPYCTTSSVVAGAVVLKEAAARAVSRRPVIRSEVARHQIHDGDDAGQDARHGHERQRALALQSQSLQPDRFFDRPARCFEVFLDQRPMLLHDAQRFALAFANVAQRLE